MMELSDETKHYLSLAMASHETCAHTDPAFCHMLIIAELALQRGEPVQTDEEIDAIGHFIANAILESLMLKGMVEVAGLDENGQFLIGLTEAGQEYAKEIEERKNEDG